MIRNLESVWWGTATHLWQTTLFLAVLFLLALLLRRTSARLLCALYWVGVAKLLLPLPLLGPVAGRLLSSGSGAASTIPIETGWTAMRVLLYPPVLEPVADGPSAAATALSLFLGAIWALGALAVLGHELRSGARRSGRAAHTMEEGNPTIRAALVRTLDLVPLDPDRVRLSAQASAPFVHGMFRPVVVLPEHLPAKLAEHDLAPILIHEAEHLRRRDPLRYALLSLVRAVFFWYPPVWWLVGRIRETTEMACDEAVAHRGVSSTSYCRSLAKTLQLGLANPNSAPVGILGHPVSFLQRRLERIRSERRFRAMHSHRIVIALAALAAVLLSLLPAAPTAADTVPWGDRLEDLEGTDVVIVLKFRQTPVEDILEILWRMAPIEAHYVGDLPDRPIDVELESVTMAEALKHLGLLAGLRYRVVGPRELEVHPVLRAGEDGVLYPSLIPESQVQPIYPEDARQQQLQGKVILQAIIDRTGTVGDILVLSSDPPGYEPFIQSAISAVGQWRYEPATRDGEPQDVSFTIVIEFQLNDEDLAAK